MDIVTHHIEEETERAFKRKERELYCAWRAGYDYLYVVETQTEDFRFERAYIPSNDKQKDFNHRRKTIMRYDLSRISHTDILSLDTSHIPTGR